MTAMYILPLTICILGFFCTILLEILLLLSCAETSAPVISFPFSCKVAREIHFLRRCVSEGVFILSLYFLDNLAGYRTLVWRAFPFRILNALPHLLCFHWCYCKVQSHSHFWFFVCDFFLSLESRRLYFLQFFEDVQWGTLIWIYYYPTCRVFDALL